MSDILRRGAHPLLPETSIYPRPLISPEQRITHYGDFVTENKLWGLFIASNPPTLPLVGSDLTGAAIVQNKIRAASKLAYGDSGQDDGHLEAMEFMMKQWTNISRHVSERFTINDIKPDMTPTVQEQIYPEVDVRLPMFDGAAGHNLDCIANDKMGNFFVIEIGRGHKSNQLARQLYLARTAYPNVTINGIVAKYRLIDKEKRRMFLRFV